MGKLQLTSAERDVMTGTIAALRERLGVLQRHELRDPQTWNLAPP